MYCSSWSVYKYSSPPTSSLLPLTGIAVACGIILVLIVVLIVFKRYRNRSSNYPVQKVEKRESQRRHSNSTSVPLSDLSGVLEMAEAIHEMCSYE